MVKWLVAAVVVVAVFVALWLQVKDPVEVPAATAAASSATPPVATSVTDVVREHQLAAIAAQLAAADPQNGKVEPSSDEFFHQFYDVQPAILTRNAAKCYTGGLDRVHRNGKVKLRFTNRIVNGEVTVVDVAVSDETTIRDQRLIDCFVREVQATRWRDDTLPDWSGPDELVLRPERGMKKYSEDSRNYQGDGSEVTPAAVEVQSPGL